MAGRATGGTALPAVPSPARGETGVPSGRRGGGAPGRPLGFCSCMSWPGATGLRMPAGMPGRVGGAGRPLASRPPPAPWPSRRIGLPTSSTAARGAPGRFTPALPPLAAPGRVGAPGLCGAPGRWGAPGLWFWLPAWVGRGLTPGRCPDPGRVGGPAGRLGWGRPTNSGLGAGRCGEGTVRFTGAGAAGRGIPPPLDCTGLGLGVSGLLATGLAAGRGVGAVGLLTAGAAGRAGGALAAGAEGAEAFGAGAAGAGRAGAGCGLAAAGLLGAAGAGLAAGAAGASAFFTDRIALPAGGLAAAAGAPFRLSKPRILPASASLIELLWLLAAMDSFSAASSTSLLSRPRSLDSS